MTRTINYLLVFFCMFFSYNAFGEQNYNLGKIEFGGADKEIAFDPSLNEFYINFIAKLGTGCNFVIIDLPLGYEIISAFSFKETGPEGKLIRFKHAYLNVDHLASTFFPIHIVKKYKTETPILRVGLYPLAEGLCQ